MPERPDPSPEALVSGLLALLDVEEIESDLYRGPVLPEGRGRLFGGQVIAQALIAATRTVGGERPAHSLHAYFLRAGEEGLPVLYQVRRDFDGRSFANRRVIAIQRDRPILNMAASFQLPEEGLEHQFAMPDVPAPEDLPSERDYWRDHARRLPEPMRAHVLRPRPIDIRPTGGPRPLDPLKAEPASRVWFRAAAPLDVPADLHRAILAYASDMRLMATAMLPHGINWFTHRIRGASLDHALWLHRDFRADEWLLFANDSPWTGGARGLSRGLVFTRDGKLVASVAQEGLMRIEGARNAR